MPQVYGARLSVEPGNSMRFGSDGGLYLPPSYVGGAGAAPMYMIDTSRAAAGQSWSYAQPGASSTALAAVPGTAALYPFAVTRTVRLAGAQINVTAAAAGSVLYQSVFGADPVTGGLGGKLADLCSFSGAAVGLAGATLRAAGFTFNARQLYWMCAWSFGAAVTLTVRDPLLAAPIRASAPPAAVAGFATRIGQGYPDTSVPWATLTAAPETAAPSTAVLSAGWGALVPHTHWLLTAA